MTDGTKGSGRRLLRSGGVLLGAQIGIAALGFLQSVAVTRAVGPADYGAWAVIVATSSLVMSFLSFRVPDALTRYWTDRELRRRPELLGALLSSTMAAEAATRILAYLIVVGLAPLVAASIVGRSDVVPLFAVQASAIVAGAPAGIWLVLLRDRKRLGTVASLELGMQGVQVAILLAMWTQGVLSLTLLAIVTAGVAIVQAGVQAASIVRTLRFYDVAGVFDFRAAWRSRSDLAGFWRLMAVGYVSGSLTTLIKQGDVLILGYFADTREIGFYRLARQLVGLIQSMLSNFALVIYQDLNEHLQGGRPKAVRDLLIRITVLWGPVAVVGLAACAAFADPLIPWIYGRDFRPAVAIMWIFLAGAALGILAFWMFPLTVALDRAYAFLNWLYALVAATLAAMMYGAWQAGATGMAIAVAAHWTLSTSIQAGLSIPRLWHAR